MARIIRVLLATALLAATFAAAQSVNCPNAGTGGLTCSDTETCCGAYTMSPKCIPAGSTDSCCTHYKSATTCNQTQTCCGMMGPGASSYAFCCNEGSTCCQSATSYSGTATCCPRNSVCCRGSTTGLCCGATDTCDVAGNRCVPPGEASPPTNAPTVAAPPTTSGPANCLAWGGSSGATCEAGETCCGADTMSPKCIAAGSTDSCCTHFKSATTCNQTQTCCGMMGPGASSYAFCCNEGSTCCQSATSYSGTATCCPRNSVCCRGSTTGLCCGVTDTCDVAGNRCVPPGVAPPPTNAPTVAAPPTTSGPANCLAWGGSSGATCGAGETCCGADTMSPKCIAAGSTDSCCTHFKSATTCNQTQTCCGMMGPGASSYAFCCNEGSTCCQSATSYSGTATCCPRNSVCCRGSTTGLCCGVTDTCDVAGNRCIPPS